MSIIQSDLLLGQEGGAGYAISRSLRFNSNDSASCARTFTSSGNRRTWTWAGWVKRSQLSTFQRFFWATGECSIRFEDDNTLRFSNFTGGFTAFFKTTAVYRDTSAWYHIVLAVDTTHATSTERLRLYVNNERVTTFSSTTYPTQNLDLEVNTATSHNIGGAGGSEYFSGLLADVFFIDSQALDPSAFTAVSATTGQLIPKAYTGTFGTNGFWLKFSDNSAATATTLGKDYSGNNNNWTPNNLSPGGINKGYIDGTSSTTGFTTAKPKHFLFDGIASSTRMAQAAGEPATITVNFPSAISVTTSLRVFLYQDNVNTTQTVRVNGGTATNTTQYGQYAWLSIPFTGSMTQLTYTSGAGVSCQIGAIEVDGVILTDNYAPDNDSLVDTPVSGSQVDTGLGGQVTGNYCTWNALDNSLNLANGNLDATTPAGSAFYGARGTFWVASGKWYWEVTPGTISAGQPFIIGVASATKLYAYYSTGQKVEDSSYTTYGASYVGGDVLGFALDLDAGTLSFYKNGTSQGQAFSGISGSYAPRLLIFGGQTSTATVANFGQRQFSYPAPAGFKCLVDTHLPVVIAKPSTAFDVKLYTGNGSTQTISGLGFSPDLVWCKIRSTTSSNSLYDIIRGPGKTLASNLTNAEASETASASLTAFNSDGFSLGTDNAIMGSTNLNGATYVAWAWDAGTTTTTNTQGSITSQVRANASAGFSIVSYTAQSSGAATIGHGLNVAPSLIILRGRTIAYNWHVYHSSLGNTGALTLNSTAAFTVSPNYWNDTSPTSTVFTGGSVSAGSGSMIAYCFAPVAGYSSFGSYVGNGSASDGPYIHLGFRPRYLCIKSTSFADQWIVFDSARNSSNVVNLHLHPNLSNNESSLDWLDFTANGFKIRTNYATVNQSSGSFLYFAFAESPFQYARAR